MTDAELIIRALDYASKYTDPRERDAAAKGYKAGWKAAEKNRKPEQ